MLRLHVELVAIPQEEWRAALRLLEEPSEPQPDGVTAAVTLPCLLQRVQDVELRVQPVRELLRIPRATLNRCVAAVGGAGWPGGEALELGEPPTRGMAARVSAGDRGVLRDLASIKRSLSGPELVFVAPRGAAAMADGVGERLLLCIRHMVVGAFTAYLVDREGRAGQRDGASGRHHTGGGDPDATPDDAAFDVHWTPAFVAHLLHFLCRMAVSPQPLAADGSGRCQWWWLLLFLGGFEARSATLPSPVVHPADTMLQLQQRWCPGTAAATGAAAPLPGSFGVHVDPAGVAARLRAKSGGTAQLSLIAVLPRRRSDTPPPLRWCHQSIHDERLADHLSQTLHRDYYTPALHDKNNGNECLQCDNAWQDALHAYDDAIRKLHHGLMYPFTRWQRGLVGSSLEGGETDWDALEHLLALSPWAPPLPSGIATEASGHPNALALTWYRLKRLAVTCLSNAAMVAIRQLESDASRAVLQPETYVRYCQKALALLDDLVKGVPVTVVTRRPHDPAADARPTDRREGPLAIPVVGEELLGGAGPEESRATVTWVVPQTERGADPGDAAPHPLLDGETQRWVAQMRLKTLVRLVKLLRLADALDEAGQHLRQLESLVHQGELALRVGAAGSLTSSSDPRRVAAEAVLADARRSLRAEQVVLERLQRQRYAAAMQGLHRP